MKNIFKKAILPLLVFGIAIAGVFATNSSMVLEQPSQPVYMGALYYKDALEQCHNTILDHDELNCTIVDTGVICTWLTLGIISEDMDCTIPLFKRTI